MWPQVKEPLKLEEARKIPAAAAAAVASVVSDSARPHRRQPTRLPRPWDSPGKNTGVGCHFLLQCMKVKSESESLSRVQLFATPWTAAHQAPLSMGFSRQEFWSFLGSMALLGPWFWISSLQNHERIHFCCFKLLTRLVWFVIAALGN